MAPGLKFGIDRGPVDGDLVPSAVGRDEGDRFDFSFEILKQVVCQAHGSVGVVSDRAVDDRDF